MSGTGFPVDAPGFMIISSANDVLFLEIVAGNTQFAAGDVSKNAFANLIGSDLWMIYRNIETGVLHWDFVCLACFHRVSSANTVAERPWTFHQFPSH